MSTVYHFDCVFYYVSDMDRAIRFYSDVLGFKLISRDLASRFEIEGLLFELVPTREKEKLGGMGNARLALRVDDMERALQHLHYRNVPVTTAEDKGNGRLAFLRDPDDNEICLWQYLSGPARSEPSSSAEAIV